MRVTIGLAAAGLVGVASSLGPAASAAMAVPGPSPQIRVDPVDAVPGEGVVLPASGDIDGFRARDTRTTLRLTFATRAAVDPDRDAVWYRWGVDLDGDDVAELSILGTYRAGVEVNRLVREPGQDRVRCDVTGSYRPSDHRFRVEVPRTCLGDVPSAAITGGVLVRRHRAVDPR